MCNFVPFLYTTFSGLNDVDLLGSLQQVRIRTSFYAVINNNKEAAFHEHYILNQRQVSSVGIVTWLHAG
jgi:hypothetical protein